MSDTAISCLSFAKELGEHVRIRADEMLQCPCAPTTSRSGFVMICVLFGQQPTDFLLWRMKEETRIDQREDPENQK